MQIRFVAGFSPIVRDVGESGRFYREALGLTFEGEVGDYAYTEQLEGVKHMGLWPLSEAARACFGKPEWPSDVPVPQATIEFDLGSAEEVADAATELEEQGYRLLHGARTEPWDQTTARLLSPEGLLVGVTFTPGHHGG